MSLSEQEMPPIGTEPVTASAGKPQNRPSASDYGEAKQKTSRNIIYQQPQQI